MTGRGTISSDGLADFEQRGFGIFPADDRAALDRLRYEIFVRTRSIFGLTGDDPEAAFNTFHALEITGPRLNELRVKLIREVTDGVDSGSLIHEAFRSTIHELLGPDLLVQKNTNLVIQQPHDPNPSELHRDAPANSPYEVVVWLPLVDCFGTKSMYVLDREQTGAALRRLDADPSDWEGFHAHCLNVGANVPVPYGSALFFWTGLFHGSRVNTESETRFSLNMRFKSLFSPGGLKEPFEFFRIHQLSPLTRLGIGFQRSEIIR